jgi:anti-sigma B factor antagonist
MDLGLEVAEHDGVAVLGLRGEVDMSTAPRLRQAIVELAAGGRHRVVVDLDKVEFLDSTGLGVLVSGLKRFRTLGGDLVLSCTQPRILRVLEITRLDRAFTVCDSVVGAVDSMVSEADTAPETVAARDEP